MIRRIEYAALRRYDVASEMMQSKCEMAHGPVVASIPIRQQVGAANQRLVARSGKPFWIGWMELKPFLELGK